MGEVDAGPAAPAKPMPDLTALEVDPSKGKKIFKAVLIHSKQGTTYRMVAKAMADGRLGLLLGVGLELKFSVNGIFLNL